MTTLSKLLGITAVGANIAKARLIRRFLNELASIITLAIATGLMVGALLIGIFYLAYQALIYYGLQPLPAQVLLACLGIAVVFVLFSLSASCMQRLKSIPGQIIYSEFPLSSRVNGIVDSFLDGLMAPKKP